jgi:tetratricopeptide (TPR) repeat protein
MNYGSLLFDQARVFYYKEGRTPNTTHYADEAKKELSKALSLFGKSDSHQAAHVNYLMGDLYSYFYEKYDKAREHYNAALKLDPDHRDAQSGLIRIGQIEASPESKKALTPVSEAAKRPSTLRTIVSPGKASAGALLDKLTLTSGEVVDVNLVEETAKGVWVEMGAGAKVFFSKSEYLKVTKRNS